MRFLVVAGFVVFGCGTDSQPLIPDAAVDAAAMGSPDALIVMVVSSNVTADTAWSDTVKITQDISIEPGVTLTVQPGTVIEVVEAGVITVGGTINIDGTKAKKVIVRTDGAAGTTWNGFDVSSGGALNANYMVATGGGITTSGTAMVTIRDSQMSQVFHDLLVVAGGTIDIQYSWIGLEQGQTDTTHCDMHFQGGGPTITVSHSNISTATYGVMFYTGLDADFTYNNWFGNGVDVDIQPAPPVSGDVSYGWFQAGTPASTSLTKLGMAPGRLTNVGPR